MSLLNPSTSNFNISFSSNFYNKDIDDKYDDYLFHLNSPIKSIGELVIESIQSVSVSGFDFQEISVNNLGGSNGINMPYVGTANQTDILDEQKCTLTFRNVTINWARMYEFAQAYYARDRRVEKFDMVITFMDSSGLPILLFNFEGCFISAIPGLQFAHNAEFNDAKNFDARISFAKFTTKFIIPEFKKKNKKIN